MAEVAARHNIPQVLLECVSELSGTLRVGELDGQVPTVEAVIERPQGSWALQASLYSEGTILVVVSILSDPVPRERRDEVARLLGALNWDLMLGNAEMDAETGTVRFRTGVFLAGDELSERQANAVVRTNIGTAALVFPAIGSVVAGTATAEEVAAQIRDHLVDHGVDLY
jgi:hypothetical protein